MDDSHDGLLQESLDRSRADLEMIQAAYPDEVTIPEHIALKLAAGDADDAGTGLSLSDFPLSFTLHLSNDAATAASLTMELPLGYPTAAGVQIADYRSHSAEQKARLDDVVRAVRAVSLDCQREGTEGAITCCATALDVWNDNGGDSGDGAGRPLSNTGSTSWTQPDVVVVDDDGSSRPNGTVDPSFSTSHPVKEGTLVGDCSRQYEWRTGEPLVDKKSTFQAHVCRVYSEREVREALHQLLTSSSKIQRATHNMYAWRIVTTMSSNNSSSNNNNNGGHQIEAGNSKGDAAGNDVLIIKHDNDDDGEDGAGSKLAYLLDMRKDENLLVVVSRWYGGIQLGPKRFAHIVNVARELLVAVGSDR